MAEETKTTAPVSSGPGKNTGMAILCYIGILILVPFLTDAKDDPFVKYHIKQGLVLIIFEVALGILSGFLWFLAILWWIIWILLFVLWIMGIINAANGKQEPLPVIGKIGESFRF